MNGFILINKPIGMTSTAAVGIIKYILNDRSIKIGHTGTLDAFASGLLIIGIDRTATRHIDTFMTLDKQYTATGKLGILTDSYDRTGQTIDHAPVPEVSFAQLQDVLNSFGNAYEQTPPIFSALKHRGNRLSHLARHEKLSPDDLQKIAGYKTRTIQLHDLKLTSLDLPFFSIQAHVSHGTYIRSLIQDIAQRIDSCATTYELARTHIGPFALANAQTISSLTRTEDIAHHILSTETALKEVEHYLRK